MIAQETTRDTVLPAPHEIDVPGPNGLHLHFTQPKLGLYQCAEILHSTQASVPIHFQSDQRPNATLIDGADADGRNFLFDARLRRDLPWSLALWSLDGRYVVLTTFEVFNNKVDQQHSRFETAYDTTTGQMMQFASKTSLLDSETFAKWSPTKPGVALLWSGKDTETEEATPKR